MVSKDLLSRNENLCELCNATEAIMAYTVSPKKEDEIGNQVALCKECAEAIEKDDAKYNWRLLESSVWSNLKSVQALSYRLLFKLKDESWAFEAMNAVDLEEDVKDWALSSFETKDFHKDAFGNKLENGDTVVLTQSLDVKGTNFTASKGTVVKKIKLISDNVEQVEGKINDQSIVILTKYLRKN